uniref:Uncharacterized protein n=1 Tax=Rhizophora mucronata TaxID=61149 RepID=A0A2P2R2J7_RHIMU
MIQQSKQQDRYQSDQYTSRLLVAKQ